MSQPQELPSAVAREQIVCDSTQQFLREHLRDVFLAAFCILGNRAEAQEVTQEAFIRLLQLYPSVTNNRQIGVAVREAAVLSAIESVRRKAVHHAEAGNRRFPRSSANAGAYASSGPESADLKWADSKWGERVVILLHDTQSFTLQKIASVLSCSREVVHATLVQARTAELPPGAIPELAAHPACGPFLAAAASRDWRKLPLRLRLHLRKCAGCQRAQTHLQAAAARNRQSALDELRSLQSVVDVATLEREMTGNIGVGVAAARCIQHVYRKRRFTWRMAAVALALTALFIAGWVTHVPNASTARLLRTVGGAFAVHPMPGGDVLAKSNSTTVFSERPWGRALTLLHPDSAVVRVIDPGQIAVTSFEPETEELMRQSLETGARDMNIDPHASISTSQVRIPAGAPVTLEEFSVVPLPNTASAASKAFRVRLQAGNASTKSIAAAVFRASIRGRGFLEQSLLSAQGLQAAKGDEFFVSGDFSAGPGAAGVSVELALDFVLFSDLTSYGSDTAENRALAADEIASRAERAYLKRLIDSGQLATARRELNFGLPAPSGANFAILDRPQQNAQPAEAAAIAGAPLQIENARAAAGKLLVTLRNRSARPIAWFQITTVAWAASGRVLVSEDCQRLTRVMPLETSTVSMQDSVHFENSVGSVRRTVFVRAAEFADGAWWVADPHVPGQSTFASLDLSTCSPERLRLGALFRRGGLAAVAKELPRAGT